MYDNKAVLATAGDVSVPVIYNTVFVNSRLNQKVAMCNISGQRGRTCFFGNQNVDVIISCITRV